VNNLSETKDMTTKYTSSGVIRNADKPRAGIVGINSLAEWIYDVIDSGINLTFESWREHRQADIKADLESQGYSGADLECETERMLETETDGADFDECTMLIGSWTKDSDGRYTPDTSGEYAAIYNSGTGNIAVEWSRHTKRCNHTSPCYVMSDGSGPCGDLDSPGDSVLAYTLPADYFRVEE
jgi:hypothetical protein